MSRTPVMYSYVVDHDHGFAPNPSDGICTLVHCKFQKSTSSRRNIVELARVNDWILGTGGAGPESAGNNKIIYLMKVEKIIPFSEYLSGLEYQGRIDCKDDGDGNKFALISRTYFYFGKEAIDINSIPLSIPSRALVKVGPNYRKDIPSEEIEKVVSWFMKKYSIGMHGNPCSSTKNDIQPNGCPQCRSIC